MHTTNYSAILCLLLCWATRILALPMIPSFPNPAYLAQLKEYDELFKRASVTRTKATTVTQSVNNWIEDVDTVNKFLNVALALPLGAPLKAGASKALAFAQDEPVNVKFLKATPGISSDGLAAAATLEKVFGDVLAQLGDVVKQPANLAVATNAVTRINVNRYVERSPDTPACRKGKAG